MSKIKDTINNETIDLYKEHSQHNSYQENCSECYKNVLMFDRGDSEEDLIEIDQEVEDKFSEDEEELEQCGGCGMLCKHLYCDKCDKEISDYEFSRQDN